MAIGRSSVLIVAGEASGDLHAGKLVARLKELDPDLNIFGVGGDRMKAAGCELTYHCDDFAVVGLTEVVRHIPKLRRAMRRLVSLAEDRSVRVAVLVDYPGFNLMLAGRLHSAGVKILYYISPQVWAWGEGRVRKIAHLVDRMAVVFPFEVDFYRERGVEVEFVGHPLLEEPAIAQRPGGTSEARGGSRDGGPVLGLLPGSRRHEIERLLPPMLGAVKLLRERVEGLSVRLGRAHGISEAALEAAGGPRAAGIEIVGPESVHDVMRNSTALLISSGTATLEAACMGTPMVIVYRLGALSYLAGRALVRIPYIGLVNVVAGRRLVPELVQGDATAQRMAAEVEPFLADPALRASLSADLLGVRNSLGEPGASARVADMVMEMAGGGA